MYMNILFIGKTTIQFVTQTGTPWDWKGEEAQK